MGKWHISSIQLIALGALLALLVLSAIPLLFNEKENHSITKDIKIEQK